MKRILVALISAGLVLPVFAMAQGQEQPKAEKGKKKTAKKKTNKRKAEEPKAQ